MSIESELEQTQPSQLQPGTILKRKREELGLSQKQIADRLRLRLTLIQNIEENQYEDGQVATFTRGYLRSYAKAVGIDESEVLGALESTGGVRSEEHEMQSFSRKTKTDKHDSRIMLLTWGIFAVIIGISSVWWWQNQKNDDLTPPPAESQAQVEDIPESDAPMSASETDFVSLEALEDAEETQIDPQESSAAEEDTPSVEDSLDAAITDEEIVDAQDSQQNTEIQENTAPVVSPNLLVMNFEADCWIQIKDASGRTLATGVKKAGQSLELDGAKPYRVVLGAPENVSMTLASEPVDLSGYTSGKVARFTLP
ncbi:cytoskeleton protein RodZ [Vibrio olivae]|uniref:Cytoskeleton protein RodZ n=1 Tax=Vibrio olivae TaxID=1243002 RepID=A0ABV5HLG4_9VIBR